MRLQHNRFMECSKSCCKRSVLGDKMSNSRNKLTLHRKKIEKEEQMKPKGTIRKDITKIGMEINVTKT